MPRPVQKPRTASRYHSSSSSSSSDSVLPPAPRPPKRLKQATKQTSRDAHGQDAEAKQGLGARPRAANDTPRNASSTRKARLQGLGESKAGERLLLPKEQLIDALRALEPGVLGRLLGLDVGGAAEAKGEVDEEEVGEDVGKEEEDHQGDEEEEKEDGEESQAETENGANKVERAGIAEEDEGETGLDDDQDHELELKAHRLSSALGAPFARAQTAAKADVEVLFDRFGSDLDAALEPFNGELLKQQYEAWHEAETAFRRQCTASYAEAHKAMKGYNEQMCELVRKIAGARASKKRLLGEARQALTELLAKQEGELKAVEGEIRQARDHERPHLVRATDPKALANLMEQSIRRMLQNELLC